MVRINLGRTHMEETPELGFPPVAAARHCGLCVLAQEVALGHLGRVRGTLIRPLRRQRWLAQHIPTKPVRPASILSPRSRSAIMRRSEEHTSELQSLMRISYAVFCLTKQTINNKTKYNLNNTTHT